MSASEWTGLLLGFLLAVGVVRLALWALRGDGCRGAQTCRFVCPSFGSIANCELVQDVRTGQWKELRRCSLLCETDGACGRDCMRRLNLGFRLEGWRQSHGAAWLSSRTAT